MLPDFKKPMDMKKISFTLFQGLKLRYALIAVAFLVNLQLFAQLTGTAPVSYPTGGFAIDGNLLSCTPIPDSSGVGDWVVNPLITPCTGGGVLSYPAGLPLNINQTFRIEDSYNSQADTIFTSGSKFDDDPNTWTWTTSKPTGKDDMNHGMVHFATDTTTGDVWFIMAGDRYATTGTSYLDFEILQNSLTYGPNGTFLSAGPHGGRTVGDIAITVEYSNGGSNAGIVAYRWDTVNPLATPLTYDWFIFTPT